MVRPKNHFWPLLYQPELEPTDEDAKLRRYPAGAARGFVLRRRRRRQHHVRLLRATHMGRRASKQARASTLKRTFVNVTCGWKKQRNVTDTAAAAAARLTCTQHVAEPSTAAAASHYKTALDSNTIMMSKLAVALPLASCQSEIYELKNNDVEDNEKGRAGTDLARNPKAAS